MDLSVAMMDRDMRPTRFDLMLEYSRDFITEWFDQNPLGQIGVVGMRAGLGERIGEMTGSHKLILILSPVPETIYRQSPRRFEKYRG